MGWARVRTDIAALSLMALFRGEQTDEAYTGATLLAEALRTIRDWDVTHFKRSRW